MKESSTVGRLALRVLVLAWILHSLELLGGDLLQAGQARPGWEKEWEKTVSAAKSEGQLTVYGNRVFE